MDRYKIFESDNNKLCLDILIKTYIVDRNHILQSELYFRYNIFFQSRSEFSMPCTGIAEKLSGV
jgi:hypothetical protein